MVPETCVWALKNKKYIVKNYIIKKDIDLCVQETELESNYVTELMSLPGFKFEPEKNSNRIRVRMFVNNIIKYVRRNALEGNNSHTMVNDIHGAKNSD